MVRRAAAEVVALPAQMAVTNTLAAVAALPIQGLTALTADLTGAQAVTIHQAPQAVAVADTLVAAAVAKPVLTAAPPEQELNLPVDLEPASLPAFLMAAAVAAIGAA